MQQPCRRHLVYIGVLASPADVDNGRRQPLRLQPPFFGIALPAVALLRALASRTQGAAEQAVLLCVLMLFVAQVPSTRGIGLVLRRQQQHC